MKVKFIVIFITTIYLVVFTGCLKTPKKYQNHIEISEEQNSRIQTELYKAVEAIHDQTRGFSLVLKPREKPLQIEFVEIFLDSSLSKTTFIIIEEFEYQSRSVENDRLIYAPLAFYGVLDDNGWEIKMIKDLHLAYASSRDKAQKHIDLAYLTQIAYYKDVNGDFKYRYNLDDVRIFNGPLFQDL